MQLSAMGQLSGEGANVVHSLHAELVTPPIPPTLSLGQRTVRVFMTDQAWYDGVTTNHEVTGLLASMSAYHRS